MKSIEQTDQIIHLAKAKLSWEERGTILTQGQPPFDISKPNFHDNKSDFEAEKATILTLIDSSDTILKIISENQIPQSSDYDDVKFNPLLAIDVKARLKTSKSFHSVNDAIALIQQNVVETGLTKNAEALLT